VLSEEMGNLLEADADALVNTVNTVGVMGKGLALQFKQAYPANFHAYRAACRQGEVRTGQVFVYATGTGRRPRFVINFPTKEHWRSGSKLSDIKAGLADLRKVIQSRGIRSIAVPPLGCGNGGLDWRDVRPLIVNALGDLPDVHILLYPPQDAPAPTAMPIGNRRPAMTTGRAALITLTGEYARQSWAEQGTLTRDGASLLEIQKLAYFLQEAGQPLRLDYAKGRYGPYAENLNHVLQALEGHYLRGYGDRTQRILDLHPITVMPGAEDDARRWLSEQGDDDTSERIGSVTRLTEGFASPYGLELLATVHWAATREVPGYGSDAAALTVAIRQWNQRKERIFTEEHIHIATGQLAQLNWLPG
jgi:O-acetyl-ADP-ribose deacetylase (regulator of RNase III)